MTRRREQTESWDLAGIRDPSGQLDRPVAANLLYVPASVELRGGRLAWVHHVYDQKGGRYIVSPKAVTPGPTLLEEFVRLTALPDEAIVSYARKWGLLGICRHNLPRTHWRKSIHSGTSTDRFCDLRLYKNPDGSVETSGWEPLVAWRRYSLKAKSLLDVAAHLHAGRIVTDNKVAVGLDKSLYSEKKLSFEVRRRFQIVTLSAELNRWLALGNVRPFFSWSLVEEPSVSFGTTWFWMARSIERTLVVELIDFQGSSLFGALGIQLLMAITRVQGFALCSECGEMYSPTRRPNANRRNYCAKCGIKAARRAASREYRARSQAPH
jgi:hypothetical protein